MKRNKTIDSITWMREIVITCALQHIACQLSVVLEADKTNKQEVLALADKNVTKIHGT